MGGRCSVRVGMAQSDGDPGYASQYDGQSPFPRVCNLSVPAVDEGGFYRRGQARAYGRYGLAVVGTGYPQRWHGQTDPARLSVMRDNVCRLRDENPRIRVLASVDACRLGGPLAESARDDWWITDSRAQRVLARYPDTYLMDLSRPGWRAHVADLIEQHVVGANMFDGLLLSGAGPWFPTDLAGGARVWIDLNRDGQADTWQELNRQWRAAAAGLLESVAAVVPSTMAMLVEDAPEDQTPLVSGSLLADALAGCYRQPTLWRDVFRRYARWAHHGRAPRVTVLSATSGIAPGRQHQADSWRFDQIVADARQRLPCVRLGLCTTLLSDGYFAYDIHREALGQPFWFVYYNADLGVPVGDAYELPGPVWTRPYQRGQVFVNPAPRTATVGLDRPCAVVDGPAGVTEVEIGALDGCVVVLADADPGAPRA